MMDFMSSEERLDQVVLRQMLDRERLYELVTRYCRAIDRADEELLLSCYHPDATQDHGAYKGEISGLVTHLRGRALDPAKGALQHVVSNCRFDLDGDVAYGETYLRTVMTDAEGGQLLSFGRYVDRFERRDGEWRIAHRQVIIDVPRAGMDTTPFVQGYRDRRDPSYRNR
jgi:ketosteroid isomerase-like protein